MRYKNKKIVLIALLFCIEFYGIFIVVVQGFKNHGLGGISMPRAIYNFNMDTHYGTHDWIADSAIRLIASSQDPTHVNKLKWLFDDSLDIEFNGGLISTKVRREGYWKQVDTDAVSRQRWLKFRRYIQFLYGTDWPDRRYSAPKTYISVDDTNAPEAEKITGYPIIWGLPRGFSHSYKRDKNFRNLNDPFLVVDHGAGINAQLAANDAINLLKYETRSGELCRKYEAAALALGAMTHFIADVAHPAHTMPRKNQYSLKADPGQELDNYVLRECDTIFRDLGGKGGVISMVNGGPDWDVIYPGDLKVTKGTDNVVNLISSELKTQGLRPIPPYLAVAELSYIVFFGYDPENADLSQPLRRGYIGGDPLPEDQDHPYNYDGYLGSNAAYCLPILDYDSDQLTQVWLSTVTARRFDGGYSEAKLAVKERIKVTVKWGVYYTACALLWVMDQIQNFQDDTSTDRFTDYGYKHPEDYAISTPVLDEILGDWNNDLGDVEFHKDQRVTVTDNIANVITSLTIILPVISLAILPTIIYEISKDIVDKSRFKEWTSPNDYPFQDILQH